MQKELPEEGAAIEAEEGAAIGEEEGAATEAEEASGEEGHLLGEAAVSVVALQEDHLALLGADSEEDSGAIGELVVEEVEDSEEGEVFERHHKTRSLVAHFLYFLSCCFVSVPLLFCWTGCGTRNKRNLPRCTIITINNRREPTYFGGASLFVNENKELVSRINK